MSPDSKNQRPRSLFSVALVLTLLLCPPLLIYAWARLTGVLPTEAQWELRGGNHGPWWDDWRGIWLLFASLGMVLLLFATVLGSCFKTIFTGRQTLAGLLKSTLLIAF